MAKEITETTRLPVRGSTIVDVTPPVPCALEGCIGELIIQMRHGDGVRVHLDDEQRRALIEALGGTWPA
jgi:hypothetical protein